MVLSSCLANFGAVCLLLVASLVSFKLFTMVQDVLKEREMTEFPFKKLLAITAMSPVLLVLLFVGFSIAGSSAKTVDLAFKEVQIEKCQSFKIASEEEGDDEEGEEEIAFLTLSCKGNARDTGTQISGNYL